MRRRIKNKTESMKDHYERPKRKRKGCGCGSGRRRRKLTNDS